MTVADNSTIRQQARASQPNKTMAIPKIPKTHLGLNALSIDANIIFSDIIGHALNGLTYVDVQRYRDAGMPDDHIRNAVDSLFTRFNLRSVNEKGVPSGCRFELDGDNQILGFHLRQISIDVVFGYDTQASAKAKETGQASLMEEDPDTVVGTRDLKVGHALYRGKVEASGDKFVLYIDRYTVDQSAPTTAYVFTKLRHKGTSGHDDIKSAWFAWNTFVANTDGDWVSVNGAEHYYNYDADDGAMIVTRWNENTKSADTISTFPVSSEEEAFAKWEEAVDDLWPAEQLAEAPTDNVEQGLYDGLAFSVGPFDNPVISDDTVFVDCVYVAKAKKALVIKAESGDFKRELKITKDKPINMDQLRNMVTAWLEGLE